MLLAVGLLKHVWPLSGQQVTKGQMFHSQIKCSYILALIFLLRKFQLMIDS